MHKIDMSMFGGTNIESSQFDLEQYDD